MQRDNYFPGGFTRNYFGRYWPQSNTIVVPPLAPPGINYGTPAYEKRILDQIEQDRKDAIALVEVLVTWLSIKD